MVNVEHRLCGSTFVRSRKLNRELPTISGTSSIPQKANPEAGSGLSMQIGKLAVIHKQLEHLVVLLYPRAMIF